jgi:hypothetical protein
MTYSTYIAHHVNSTSKYEPLTLLLTNLEKRKLAAVTRPEAPRALAKRSRHIPAAVRREVCKRDGGQCAFLGRDGRCTERGFLEFHHVTPYALDGPTTAENLQTPVPRA